MDKSKFTTVDGMRGVAALCVMAFHYGTFGELAGDAHILHDGDACVDLFFALSGFVLAYAYEPRFATGLSTIRYMILRLIRLYPIYLAGIVLAIASQVVLLQVGYYTHPIPRSVFLSNVALGLLFLPKLWPGSGFFPFNPPAWSLFLELLANWAHRLGFRKLTAPMMLAMVAISYIGILLSPDHNDLGISSFAFYLSRVGFSFFAGILTFRLWRVSTFRPTVSPWLLVAALVVIFELPIHRVSYFLFPPLIYLGACVEPKGVSRPIFAGLGNMSYAVYMLQMPLLTVMQVAWLKFSPFPTASLAPWIIIPAMAVVMIAAVILDLAYDRPVRKWLMSIARSRSVILSPGAPEFAKGDVSP